MLSCHSDSRHHLFTASLLGWVSQDASYPQFTNSSSKCQSINEQFLCVGPHAGPTRTQASTASTFCQHTAGKTIVLVRARSTHEPVVRPTHVRRHQHVMALTIAYHLIKDHCTNAVSLPVLQSEHSPTSNFTPRCLPTAACTQQAAFLGPCTLQEAQHCTSSHKACNN